MARTYEELRKANNEAVKKYIKSRDRYNIMLPDGTKERIEALGLSCSPTKFMRDTILAKIDELERLLK